MNFIVAIDENWGIGKDNNLLFDIPEDMKYFREKTMGKVVVMGERTLNSFPGGKPLAGRTNIVLTDDADFNIPGTAAVHSLTELFAELKKYSPDDVYVIGGASVYNQLMDHCERAYITKVSRAVPADVSIDNLDEKANWVIEKTSDVKKHGDIEFTFNVYRNKEKLHGV